MTRLYDFPHEVGVHCGSTTLANLMRWEGRPLSEAMAFGLGGGISFYYMVDKGYRPSRRFHGRIVGLEERFYAHIGAPLAWAEEWAPDRMAAVLTLGRPVLAITDIYGLPHYDNSAHFQGHSVVVTAVDLAEETAEIVEIFSPKPLTVPLADLKVAMAENLPPVMAPFQWTAPPRITQDPVTLDSLKRALTATAEMLLRPSYPNMGVAQMRQMAEELPRWREAADWPWCARFGYQVIEKRGTGGGCFRYLFADFVEEAAQHLTVLARLGAAERYREAGRLWTELASVLKRVSLEEDPSPFAEAGELMGEIAERETGLIEEIDRALKLLF